MTEIDYGSFCTGYDGLGEALRLAGLAIRPRWFSEVEASVGKVLATEYPGVPNVGDIKAAPWHLAPKTRIVSSGDPCQSISIAGRQAGRDDPRFLWPWVRAAYREIMPEFLFFENVANIVGHDKGRTMAERFEHLREDGYAVRWTVLGACAVGAPHHRHRWYALAAYVGPGAPDAVRIGTKQICGAPRSGGRFLLPSPMARDGDGRGEGDPAYWQRRLAERGRTNGMPLGAAVQLLPTPDASMSTRGGLLSPEYALRRIADVNRSSNLDDAVASLLPSPTARDGSSGPGRTAAREGGDDLRTLVTLLPTPLVVDAADGTRPVPADRTALGPDYGPRLKDVAVHLLPTPRASDGEKGRGNPGQTYGSGSLPLSTAACLLPTPTAGDADRGTGSIGSTGSPMLGAAALAERWGKYAESVALWEVITGYPAPPPTELGRNGGPRLSAALPEWMMGLRPGLLTDELSRPEALKAAGNGVVALAAATAYRMLVAG
jgi:DNA (cytosine-5)-methyltransferase 1